MLVVVFGVYVFLRGFSLENSTKRNVKKIKKNDTKNPEKIQHVCLVQLMGWPRMSLLQCGRKRA